MEIPLMKKLLFLLFSVLLVSCSGGGGGGVSSSVSPTPDPNPTPIPTPPSKTVHWTSPQSFSDGTKLDPSRDLQGYEIYIKQELPFGPDDNPVATLSHLDTSFYLGKVTPPLPQGVTYYISLRTVAANGVKSVFSLPASFSP
jgi:hypothetical protein